MGIGGGGRRLKRVPQKHYCVAAEVDSLVGESNEVHCIIFIAQNEQSDHNVFLIYSPVLIAVFDSTTWGSSIACSALTDAFLVVRRLSTRRQVPDPRAQNSYTTTNTSELQLPTWIASLCSDTPRVSSSSSATDGRCYVLYDDSVIARLLERSHYYSAIFTVHSSMSCIPWSRRGDRFPAPRITNYLPSVDERNSSICLRACKKQDNPMHYWRKFLGRMY